MASFISTTIAAAGAGAALHRRRMSGEEVEDQDPKSCRALVTSSTSPPPPPNSSPLSYVVSITISQPKIRIKIPKLLAKTMRRSTSECTDEGSSNHSHKGKKKWGRLGSMMSGVFGGRKSSRACSNGKKSNACDQSNLQKEQILKKVGSDALPHGGDHQTFALASESPLLKSFSLKKILEIEDQEAKPKRANNPVFSSFFHTLTRGKDKKTKGNSIVSDSCCCNGVKRNTSARIFNPVNGSIVGGPNILIGRQESRSGLPRVPSGILTTRQKLKMAWSLRKIVTSKRSASRTQRDGGDVQDDRGGEQLCKKRILMGGKCKPLNLSGTLQYDKDGVLLPEIIPW